MPVPTFDLGAVLVERVGDELGERLVVGEVQDAATAHH
jgi:hypothetical protein